MKGFLISPIGILPSASNRTVRNIQKVLVDGGYTGEPFAQAVKEKLGATVEVVKRNELHTFVVLPKRWIAERSFA